MKIISIRLFAGAIGCALILQFPAAATATTKERVLYSFGGGADGANPAAGVIEVKGLLYGVTYQGGIYNFGTVFSVDAKTGAETVLHSFGSGTDGVNPNASLIDVKDTLYSTTLGGGSYDDCGSSGCGTLYSLDPDTGAEKVLYSFCSQQNCPDGATPYASLLAVHGRLYGTTVYGGYFGDGGTYGTVFALDRKTGVETVVYAFCSQQQSCTDGMYPAGNLIEVKDKMYGTTVGGGDGSGTVFALDPKTGTEIVLYNFGSRQNGADGVYPYAGLSDVNGTLYGTTGQGGSNSGCANPGCGVVFSVNPTTGEEQVVYSFCGRENCADGEAPEGNLIDVNGKLYGTTSAGGNNSCQNFGCGVVFSVDPATGAEKVVYSFCGQKNCTDGEFPTANLTYVNGMLYGTTANGGAHGYGTVFALKMR